MDTLSTHPIPTTTFIKVVCVEMNESRFVVHYHYGCLPAVWVAIRVDTNRKRQSLIECWTQTTASWRSWEYSMLWIDSRLRSVEFNQKSDHCDLWRRRESNLPKNRTVILVNNQFYTLYARYVYTSVAWVRHLTLYYVSEHPMNNCIQWRRKAEV